MRSVNNLYTYNLITDENILHFKLLVPNLDKDNATAIFDGYTSEKNLPDFSDFILDATQVKNITDSAIGILMKAMAVMKKAKGYLVLIMTDEFLQNVMVAHPEMFNYLAVFHSGDEAIGFIKKSKK